MKDNGFPVFRNSSKNYNLNLIGERTFNNDSNTFNDFLHVMWFFGGVWTKITINTTTDPGVYWRENPMNVNGTAILCEGHHKGLWMLGKHKGSYEALVQKGPAQVYRDNNKDSVLDMVVDAIESGYFGINLHRSNSKATSMQVSKWSAGCQVVASSNDYEDLMFLIKEAVKNWGNSFSYTLLLDTWFND